MGDIKKKRKLYSRPKKPFDKQRIEAENVLVEKYGLKNKREIWKATAKVSTMRRQAKKLIGASVGEQNAFLEKVNKLGIHVSSIAEVLGLKEEAVLDRRLQTVVTQRKLANTPKQARQFIVHKHIAVKGNIVNIPSFHVPKGAESTITINVLKEKKSPVKEKGEDHE